MILGYIHKLSNRLPGRKTGKPACAPLTGCGGARASFSFGLKNLLACLQTAAVTAVLPALVMLSLAPSVAFPLTPSPGDLVVNSASLTSAGITTSISTVTVTVVVRTPSTIEFLTYAPLLSGAELINVAPSAYRTGGAAGDPFVTMPAPVPVGSTTPIDLSRPVPLTATSQLHQGEPLFIRLTDKDQNLNRLVAETVFVTITNPANGEVEVIRLTETGPDTGVFIGYLPTSSVPPVPYSGNMSVVDGQVLTVRYVDIVDGSDSSTTAIMIDPFGIVFNSGSGLPVNGASITMINSATGLPATIFGDDGVSIYPATLISGGSAKDSSGREYAFQPGGYRFPFVLPGTYQYRITSPAGYTGPSTVPSATIQTLPGAPFALVSGSRAEAFTVNPGPALRIDIPLDPSAGLWLQKTAGKDSVGQGDFIPYRLTLTNSSSIATSSTLRVVDTLPPGLRLRSGSVRINGLPAAGPTVSGDGRTLSFDLGILAGSSTDTIDYVVEVTAGTRLGPAINSAVALFANGTKTNSASATVTIKDDFLRTRSTLMGRVSSGACSDETGEGPDGIEGVRVYLEDGSFVISDKRGLFHFEGVRAGLHVVQMDLDSLPDGYEANPCTENSRFAGRAYSQFVETQGGTLWRTDFHIRSTKVKPVPAPVVAVKPAAAPALPKGEIILELASTVEGQSITYHATMRGNAMPLQAARLNVTLPEGVLYEPDSSRMDGAVIADPSQNGTAGLVFRLDGLPAVWRHEITFRGRLSGSVKNSKLVTQAYLATDGDSRTGLLTPPAETTLQLNKDIEIQQMPEIVLRPHFPVMGDELSVEDRERLDETARLLVGLNTERIHVTGHTDNVRIAPRSRDRYRDNQALSMGRARSVGHYLMDKLHFPPEKLSLDGKGESAPIADNRTEAGRALNRRVEVRISSTRIIDRSRLQIIKAFSGEQRAETAAPIDAVVPAAPEMQPANAAVAGSPASAAPVVQNTDTAPARPETGGTAAITAGAASAVTTAGVLTSAPSAVPAASAPGKEPATTIKDADGILSPAENAIILDKINGIRICLSSRLTPRLLVDNKEVPAERIGFSMKDTKAEKTLYSYIGVDFGERGDHVVQLQGMDPFGNARFKQTITVKRSGEIASIRLKSAEGNVADGKTPVKFKLELYDVDGVRIPAETALEIRGGTLKPIKENDLFASAPVAGSFTPVQMSRDGDVLFQPVTSSGLYRIVLGYNAVAIEVETYVQPKLRDWILVGLAEGTLGYNTASGNMESLQGTNMAEDLYKDGRVALFAKGQVQGKWLLTMAYDTAKTKADTGDGLFQTINPDTFYTLYGDASQQQYDSASAKKLYIKIEREQFYAMFGDYDTGLTVTELSRYSRRMTGVKTELQARNYEVNAFASETDQAYVRDEIPGDGTSGIYRISRRNIVPNSEIITLEVRDRFRSEVLVSSRLLSRFADYSIDYDTGAVIFKEPIHDRDEKFNPITIVVEYEVRSAAGQDYTYGGRAGVKLLDNRLKAGGTYIHEGQGDRAGNLYGADASLKLGETTKLRAEFASSDFSAGTDRRNGNAYLAELLHTSKQYDVKGYFREQDAGFGLGQQPGSEAGTRKFGVEGAYRFSEHTGVSANTYRQYNLLTGAVRDVAEGKLNYTDKKYGASIGVLYANDRLGDSSSRQSTQVTMGGKVLTLYDRLTLTMDHAQSIGSNSNSDFPTRTTLGAEFKATKNVSLLAAQEFTWGTGAITQNTRLGMRSTLWEGAAITSSVERQFNENDERVFANVGLKQSWKISDAWKIDAGLDRSQTLAKASHYQFNTSVPPASGTNENFTAVSSGASYQVKHLTWDNRLEYRLAASERKWGLLSGLVAEVDSRWAWSGRAQIFQTHAAGIDTTKANLRYGLVFRPPQTKWILLNRLDCFLDRQSGGASSTNTSSLRFVNNLNANYRPRKDLQVSLQYGAKVVRETIDGSTYSSFTDNIGVETRYDITKKWDIGMRGSLLHSWHSGQLAYSFGPSLGCNIVENTWVSVGYNLLGYEDKDFSSAAYTAQGPFLRFRMKFDQQTVKDAASWINKQ
ncbi:MAG: OmpA family protein [Desulfuromonadales bacterium]|nr:OmpA family protein [Desulfuromonadales bacterium]